MSLNFMFFCNSALLGAGLAMDAFSVSAANALNEPNMKKAKMLAVAGVFAGFQALMPMTGWFCVHTFVSLFSAFQKFIPWISLLLLLGIGINMLVEGLRNDCGENKNNGLGLGTLLVQGVATSIDALSVGFAVSDYDWITALVAAIIIACVTFAICLGGLAIGKKFGTKLSGRASVLGGAILIIIGVEIFIKGIWF